MAVEKEFWKWFVRYEKELFDFDPDLKAERERIFDKLSTELHKVNSDLTFEFGPKATRREFIVSADGIKSAFAAVTSLVNCAPKLDRWRVTAFRPRHTPPNVLEFRGRRVDPKDVQFTLLDDGKNAGISLFIPDFREGDGDWRQIGYLLLDDVLGEFDVETQLGLIKMLSPDTQTEGRRFPLAELPRAFDLLVSRLSGRSRVPS